MIIVGLLGIFTTLLFIYLILADVGRGRRLHAQLVEERGRAEKLARVKEEFLANMSHEIRTPLNSIVGFAEQLSLVHQDQNQSQFTHAIQRSANHLLALVNQVLDFSKIEAGKQQNADEPFDLFELLRDVCDTFKMRAEEKKISLTWHTHGYVPQYLQGNALSLKQIMINLTANAIKFTERGGVTINCNSELNNNDSGILLRIEVQDTGIGIPAEMTEKIFEEFNQSEPSVSRKFGGTGLGLTITKRLTELLNGSVEVKSEPGTGSLFTVILPFKKAQAALVNNAEVAIDAAQPVFSGRKILIADDEEMNVLLCKTILNKWGIETHSAGDGEEALLKFFSEDFDAVLLDLQMPEVDGISAAKSIRSSADPIKQNVPLIAFTANVYSNQEKELANAGFNTVLFKPFREKELAEVLTKLFHITENNSGESDHTHITAQQMNYEQLPYNLEYLRKTSGSNHEFLISMLESFIENNDRHLKLLADAASKKDWKAAGQVAHKMIPSYRYLQITETEIRLKRIEESAAENNEVHNIPRQVAEISESSQMVFGLLRTEIKGLKDEVVVPIKDQKAFTSIKL